MQSEISLIILYQLQHDVERQMDGWVTHWVDHSTNNNKKTNNFAMNWDMFDWRTSLYYRVLKRICVCYKPTVTQVTRLVQHRRAVKQDWASSDLTLLARKHQKTLEWIHSGAGGSAVAPFANFVVCTKDFNSQTSQGWKKKPQLRNYRSEMKFPSKTKRCFRYLFVDIAMHWLYSQGHSTLL